MSNAKHKPPAGDSEFAAMLAEYARPDSLSLAPGDRVTVKVIHIGAEAVFCALSPTQEGFLDRSEVTSAEGDLTVALGDELELYVINMNDGIELRRRIGRDQIDVDLLERARETGMPIEGVVSGLNKGGLEVTVGGARGFCPLGQIDVDFVAEPAALVGKTLEFVVREVRENGRNVLLSRRALLEARRREQADKLLATLAVGDRREGTVTRLADFGAFVDLGGLEGLIPMSALGHGQIEHARDVLREGEAVLVEVTRIEDDPKRPGKKRVSLSRRATLEDPLDTHALELREGATLTGRVTRIEKYGAFVELFPGAEGLVHISELSSRRIRHPGDVVQRGQEVAVRIVGVDRDARRIALSLRQAGEDAGAVLAGGQASSEEAPDATLSAASRGGGLGTLGDRLRDRRSR